MNEKLEQLIVEKVGSKNHFAELIGVYPQNINKMVNPPLDVFARMVQVLEIKGDDVIDFGKELTKYGQMNNTKLVIDVLSKTNLTGQEILEVLNAYIN